MLLTEYNKSVLNVTYMSLSATEMLCIIYHHIFKYKYTTFGSICRYHAR